MSGELEPIPSGSVGCTMYGAYDGDLADEGLDRIADADQGAIDRQVVLWHLAHSVCSIAGSRSTV